jgi:hypothetical protein
MVRRFLDKMCLDIKSVQNAISDIFDGQTFFWKKSALTSKVFEMRFLTFLMARPFSEEKRLVSEGSMYPGDGVVLNVPAKAVWPKIDPAR